MTTAQHSHDIPLEAPRASNVISDTVAESLRHPAVDVQRLEVKLRAVVSGEVRFDNGSRALYSADASNYRQVPIGVVVPRSAQDIVETVRICREEGAPVLGRGGGTSQNGQCVNVAVVIDTSKYLNRLLEIDPARRVAVVEPGVVCDQLRSAAEEHGLTFGPDPATHSRCTLGGMIGNNSCGAHSVMAGKTIENLESMEVLTYDGARFRVGPTSDEEYSRVLAAGGRQAEIYRRLKSLAERYAARIRSEFPDIRRRVSGYNLEQLLPENGFNIARALVGTEGTCALTLTAQMRLIPSPRARVLLVLGYADIYSAADASPDVMSFAPIALEGLDQAIIGGLLERNIRVADVALLPPGHAWLIAEFGADTIQEAADRARAAAGRLTGASPAPTAEVYLDAPLQARIWALRELGVSATAMSNVVGDSDPIVGWEDAAVDPRRLGDYLRAFQQLVDSHGYRTCLYGHFGDGCVHARINFDLRSAAGLAQMGGFLRAAARLVVEYGGSLSGEHGDGQAKAELLPLMFSNELMQAFREFKAIWDPDNRMNPGKKLDAYRIDDNLRLGPDYRPAKVHSHFAFAGKQKSFSRAVEHCIGMGRCRSRTDGLMCPSYRASGEEAWSTRGRARLLFEMLKGEVITDGWRSEEVKDALDTCLGCKGCRSECPTHVDMASYKAEFLSHYYEHRRRPLRELGVALVHRWLPIASRLSALLNLALKVPLIPSLAKAVAGIARQRDLPVPARQSFRSWFEGRPEGMASGTRVVLWVDTFNNYFHPQVARAAVEVMEKLGFHVVLSPRGLCCGRPLYDHGLLDEAKRLLTDIVTGLKAEVESGTQVVGLEPACTAVFRDELLELLPLEDAARALSRQVVTFSEFVAQHSGELPRLTKDVVLHGHCHQKALWGMSSELALLDRLGIKAAMPESGCCGMAGAFGYSPNKYAMSMTLAESSLLPAVRAAGPDSAVVANGYSCREQIRHGTGVRAMHIAEIVRESFGMS